MNYNKYVYTAKDCETWHHMVKTLPASLASPDILLEIITTLEHGIQFLSHHSSQPGTGSDMAPPV